jgi:tripartite ATP-independent transporter DctP family solute receptor
MKKLAVLAITALLAAGLVFANGGQESSSGAKAASSNASGSASTAAPAKKVVVQIAYENNPGEQVDQACHQWKTILEKMSGGQFDVQLFPSSQLGSKDQLIDQIQSGMNVVTIADGSFLGQRGAPDLGIVFAPYIFSSWDDCWKLEKSDWWKQQMALVEKNGIKAVTANWIYGDRETNTKKPIRTPDDFNGIKIRVPNTPIQIEGMRVMGAIPTPMALGDVYTAMQQGVIDGMENPLATIYGQKTYEVAKYITMDAHIKNFSIWICSTTWFNSLTPDQQKWLCESGDQAGLYNNKIAQQDQQKIVDELKAKGVEIINLTPDQLKAFQEKAKGFYNYPDIKKMFSPGLYDTVKAAMK